MDKYGFFSVSTKLGFFCFYSKVHPENPDWTCFEQTATLDIKSFFGFENTMEKLGMKQYSQNIAKGKEIIEYFIAELKEEGIEHVPRWEGPEDQESDAR